MKKKIGTVYIKDKKDASLNKELPIWGTVFKNEKEQIYGGVYLSISEQLFETYAGFIKYFLMKLPEFKLSFKKEFWGDYFSISIFGNLNYKNFDDILKRFNYFQSYENDKYRVEIKIEHDFKYVVDSNIVENI